MSLLLGLIGGLAYGLSAFAGAFLALPLLVLGAGFGLHASLPVALAALALCAAVAAGDAARARQCDSRLALVFVAGAAPAAIAASWLAQSLPPNFLVSVFALAALVTGALSLHVTRGQRQPPLSPVSLWRSPRRALAESAAIQRYPGRAQARVAFTGTACGLLMALCAAPGSWIGGRVLQRYLPSQPYQLAGTLVMATAALAVVAAAIQFALAPAAPGYSAGLYVLGAVAGMGAARRLDHPRLPVLGNRAVAVVLMVAASALWLAVITGWRAPA